MAGHDEIKLDYGLAGDMAKTFQEGAEQLQDVMQEMTQISNMLEEGALLGRGGVAFVDAIRSKLNPSISKLTEKFTELKGDVEGAIKDMQEADKASADKF
jgi:WXG100 family type VII secretion target